MTRPFTMAELRAMNLKTFRFGPLPEVARDFGHSPLILDRVASEHSASICRRLRLVSTDPAKE